APSAQPLRKGTPVRPPCASGMSSPHNVWPHDQTDPDTASSRDAEDRIAPGDAVLNCVTGPAESQAPSGVPALPPNRTRIPVSVGVVESIFHRRSNHFLSIS